MPHIASPSPDLKGPKQNCFAVTVAYDACEALFGQQYSGVSRRISKNAEINAKMEQFIALKSIIGHMVPNFCSGNPGAIAAWTSAAHV
jgi:hypothetical protein